MFDSCFGVYSVRLSYDKVLTRSIEICDSANDRPRYAAVVAGERDFDELIDLIGVTDSRGEDTQSASREWTDTPGL